MSIKINDIHCDPPGSWGVTAGLAPQRGTFEMHRLLAAPLIKDFMGKEITLSIGDQTYKKLFLVGLAVTDHIDRVSLVVADWRFWLPYTWIGPVHFNETKKSGERHWASGLLLPNAQIANNLRYKRITLKNETDEWEVSDVFAEMAESVRFQLVGTVDAKIDPLPNARVHEPIKDDFYNESGHYAMARVLTLMDGVHPYIDQEGAMRFMDEFDQSELQWIAAEKTVRGQNIPVIVDKSYLRPRKVEVLFTVEQEVRFDFSGWDATYTLEDRYLDNVAIVSSANVTVGGKSVSFGNYLSYGTYLTAMAGQHITASLGIPNLDVDKVLQLYVPKLLMKNYAWMGNRAFDPVFGRIVTDIYAGFGTRFQITPYWMDRISYWLPSKVSVVEPSTQQRAPAAVYSNYAIKYFTNVSAKNRNENNYVWENIEGYAQNIDLPTVTPVTAELSMKHHDLGVFDLTYQNSFWGTVQCIPFTIVDATLPLVGMLPGVQKAIRQGGDMGIAGDDLNVAVVITMSPIGSRGKAAVYKYEVTPDMMNDFGFALTPDQCKGPIKRISVPASLCTAWFAWMDRDAEVIEGIFGAGINKNVLPEVLMKSIEGNLINTGTVDNVARAYAASEYQKYITQAEGSIVFGGLSDVPMTGAMISKTHAETAQGEHITRVNFRNQKTYMDPTAFMPEGVRKMLGLTHFQI